ncbi:MAG: UDP-glucose 6-dehydrogenase, partial [Desulfobacterales bacterium]|nr:UDP-glucose 6-dehydrogenase [Desulfobacterales bacterium]
RNSLQKEVLGNKVKKRFGGDLSDKTFGLWGLAFKPGTDDMREASSMVLMESLVKAGARILAYDPVAMSQAKREIPAEWADRVTLAPDQYQALENADACILVTEWKAFRQPDFRQMKQRMKSAVIFDGRNQYDPEEVAEEGFEYHGIGREL